MSVESAYQGSKVFEKGGPFHELYDAPSREAKKEERLRGSGRLIEFNLLGEVWPIEPVTGFYEWLYITALLQNPDLAERVLVYKAFSDIAFNPKRSLNCQARAAAFFVALRRRGVMEQAARDRETFIEMVTKGTGKQAKDSHGVRQIDLPLDGG
jgi:hypothetical protein